MIKQWHILQPDPDKVEALSAAIDCHPVTAAVLINRGVNSAEEAVAMREVNLQQLRPPFTLRGMQTAVERICTALKARQKILIFGDYDVDGVTATAVLFEFFRTTGADTRYYIPDRRTDGYGLKTQHIQEQAVAAGIDLIITADCGSNDCEAVAAAGRAGIDVIITDHHLIRAPYPKAVAIVNPQQAECNSGFDHIAGVGVAFYLVMALRMRLRQEGFWRRRSEPNLKRFCDLVALGTVADLVPLIGENRVFTRVGLELMNANSRLGLNALREIAGVLNKPIDVEDIAFRLAPRINAAGRIGHATAALALLLSENRPHALKVAQDLDEFNTTRQNLEKNVTGDILTRLKADPGLLQKRVLVMADPQWHQGVLGIAASKIVSQFYRPVVLLNLREGTAKGSARSIPGVDLFKGLTACRRWLDSFGGHAQAAGLSLQADNIDNFRGELDRVVREAAEPNTFIPKLTLDAELDFEDICPKLIEELKALKPYGAQLPEPLFLARQIEVTSSQIVGGHHRRMTLRQKATGSGRRMTAIHFNPDRRAAEADRFDRVAFRLRQNTWNGKTTLQLLIEEAQPPAAGFSD